MYRHHPDLPKPQNQAESSVWSLSGQQVTTGPGGFLSPCVFPGTLLSASILAGWDPLSNEITEAFIPPGAKVLLVLPARLPKPLPNFYQWTPEMWESVLCVLFFALSWQFGFSLRIKIIQASWQPSSLFAFSEFWKGEVIYLGFHFHLMLETLWSPPPFLTQNGQQVGGTNFLVLYFHIDII